MNKTLTVIITALLLSNTGYTDTYWTVSKMAPLPFNKYPDATKTELKPGVWLVDDTFINPIVNETENLVEVSNVVWRIKHPLPAPETTFKLQPRTPKPQKLRWYNLTATNIGYGIKMLERRHPGLSTNFLPAQLADTNLPPPPEWLEQYKGYRVRSGGGDYETPWPQVLWFNVIFLPYSGPYPTLWPTLVSTNGGTNTFEYDWPVAPKVIIEKFDENGLTPYEYRANLPLTVGDWANRFWVEVIYPESQYCETNRPIGEVQFYGETISNTFFGVTNQIVLWSNCVGYIGQVDVDFIGSIWAALMGITDISAYSTFSPPEYNPYSPDPYDYSKRNNREFRAVYGWTEWDETLQKMYQMIGIEGRGPGGSTLHPRYKNDLAMLYWMMFDNEEVVLIEDNGTFHYTIPRSMVETNVNMFIDGYIDPPSSTNYSKYKLYPLP